MLYKSAATAKSDKAAAQEAKNKLAKGESSMISLQMFKQGKPISDIAAERGFAVTTIEGH
jgi:uncharacterized protein YpbB